jgi:hypothetical protein
MKVIIFENEYYIRDEAGVEQPAYKHEDGTIVSKWDNLNQLLIADEDGVRYISHAEAVEYGYED